MVNFNANWNIQIKSNKYLNYLYTPIKLSYDMSMVINHYTINTNNNMRLLFY